MIQITYLNPFLTLALVQPVLAPYRFIAMKFFPGYLGSDGLNSYHPLTTRII